MFMRKISAAISATVESSSGVNVPVLPHVVGRGVVLAADDADVPLLPVAEGPKAVALTAFGGRRCRSDLLLVDHVVRVVVRHVVVFRLRGKYEQS
jgi:hypothetical protein